MRSRGEARQHNRVILIGVFGLMGLLFTAQGVSALLN